jgi:hypothetical protein
MRPRRVFVGHTSELAALPTGRSFVAAAQAAVTRAGDVVVEMAYWTSEGLPPARLCREVVAGCDLYVGVVGFRYGAPVADEPSRSYMELEFEAAGAMGLDRRVFLVGEDVGLPRSAVVDEKFGGQQKAFRARLRAELVPQVVSSPDQLELMLYKALVESSPGRAASGRAGSGWVVFVSHTSDMIDYPPGRSFVQAALDAVLKAGAAPVDMAYFAAREGKPAEYCQQQVRACDVYVGLVGFRYGSLVPNRDDEVSYTDLEFRAATDAGIPRVVFLVDEETPVPPRLVDRDSAAVDAFRDRLHHAGVIVKTVSTPDALEAALLHALYELGGGSPPPAAVDGATPVDLGG